MTLKYGFYQSRNHDRVYSDDDFNRIFDGIIEEGVYKNVGMQFNLSGSTNNDMTVIIGSGRAWLQHIWVYNDSPYTLTVATASQTLDRIDSIILEIRKGINYRDVRFRIITGTPANSPVAPSTNSSMDIYQYLIGTIYVKAKTTTITRDLLQSAVGIGDLPWVTAPLQSISMDRLYQNWQLEWKNNMNVWEGETKGTFNSWFSGLKNSLNSNTEARLVSDVFNLKNEVDKYTSNSKGIDYKPTYNLATDPYFENEAPGNPNKGKRPDFDNNNIIYKPYEKPMIYNNHYLDHYMEWDYKYGLSINNRATKTIKAVPGETYRVGVLVSTDNADVFAKPSVVITGRIYNNDGTFVAWTGDYDITPELRRSAPNNVPTIAETTITIPDDTNYKKDGYVVFEVVGINDFYNQVNGQNAKMRIYTWWIYDVTESDGVLPTNLIGNSWHGKSRENMNASETLLINHRGGTGFPEQSISGCKWAIEHGLIPEVDVRLLADGSPVLCHDDNITRTMYTNETETMVNRIANLDTWREKYHMKPVITGGFTEEPPTLEHLLQVCGNRGILNIEVKDLTKECLYSTLSLINRYHCKDSVILASFDTYLMQEAKYLGFTTMVFAENMTQVDVVVNQMTWRPDYCGVTASIATRDTYNKLNKYGIMMTAWTIDSAKTAQNALDAGAVGITSNRPLWIRDIAYKEGGKLVHDGLALFRKPGLSDGGPIDFPYGDDNGHGLSLNGEYLTWSGQNHKNGYVIVEPFESTNINLTGNNAFNIVSRVFSNIANAPQNHDSSIIEFWLMSYDNIDERFINPGMTNEAVGLVFKRDWNARLFVKQKNGSSILKETFKLAGANTGLIYDSRITFDFNIHFHNNSLSFLAGSSIMSMSDWRTMSYGFDLDNKYKLVILFDDFNTYSGVDAEFSRTNVSIPGTGR